MEAMYHAHASAGVILDQNDDTFPTENIDHVKIMLML